MTKSLQELDAFCENLIEYRTEEHWPYISGKERKILDFIRDISPIIQEVGILREKHRRTKNALHQLTAIVRGECPSLLNEDSGGWGELSCEIDEILADE